MSVGIYKIENQLNHKIYIGQSTRIERRFSEHCRNETSVIDRAIKKYGANNFSFEILEECPVDELDEKEKFYIGFFKSITPNGYNITEGGRENHENFYYLSQQNVEDIRQALLNSDLSFEEIGQKFGITSRSVRMINDGGSHYSDNYLYPIREVLDLSKKFHYCEKCGKEISKGAKFCKSCFMTLKYQDKPVNQITRQELKDLIRTKPFTEIGRMFGVSDNAVRKWCDKYNLPRKPTEIKKYTDKEWTNL